MANYTGETIGLVSMLIGLAYIVTSLVQDHSTGSPDTWWSILALIALVLGMIALGFGVAKKAKRK